MSLFGLTVELNSVEDLLLSVIEDLYASEKSLTKALPKMVEAASSPQLKQAFQHHLSETEQHVVRLEEIFRTMDKLPRGESQAMNGLVEDGEDVVNAKGDSAVKDAALIAAAQRVEHYEMAGYGSARTFADLLGLTNVSQLLAQSLEEEKEADSTLTNIARTSINVSASLAHL